MGKAITIPTHIVNSGDADHWYNLINSTEYKIGTLNRDGNDITVTDMTVSRLRTVLDESSYMLSELLKSSNINTDSYYCSNKANPNSMGEMAGYNHVAKPSTYFSEGASWGTINRNISPDGANWKITISGLALRRGEKLPPSGYVKTWNDIKVDAAIYKKDGEFWEIDPTDTDSITGIDVSQMRNNTAVGNLVFNVPNTNETYRLVVQGKYTYQSTATFETLYIIVNTAKYCSYTLQAGRALPDWEAGVWAPMDESYTYTFWIKNLAADTGNSQSYGGYVYVKFSFYYEITPVNFFGLSELVNISPQEIELIEVEWNQGMVPEIGIYGWDNTKEYSVTIYEGDDTSDPVIRSKVWNEGL